MGNPLACLDKLGIETPEDVSVAVQTTNTKRPSIIVFKKKAWLKLQITTVFLVPYADGIKVNRQR